MSSKSYSPSGAINRPKSPNLAAFWTVAYPNASDPAFHYDKKIIAFLDLRSVFAGLGESAPESVEYRHEGD
jgi:hypothetical protein